MKKETHKRKRGQGGPSRLPNLRGMFIFPEILRSATSRELFRFFRYSADAVTAGQEAIDQSRQEIAA